MSSRNDAALHLARRSEPTLPSMLVVVSVAVPSLGLVMRCGLHVDNKRNRDDPALMFELRPSLVQAGFRESCVEGDHPTICPAGNASVFTVFVVLPGVAGARQRAVVPGDFIVLGERSDRSE